METKVFLPQGDEREIASSSYRLALRALTIIGNC